LKTVDKDIAELIQCHLMIKPYATIWYRPYFGFRKLESPDGFEPSTRRLEGSRSASLSSSFGIESSQSWSGIPELVKAAALCFTVLPRPFGLVGPLDNSLQY
jgi:hypothetical protein